jgi:hypothetical protein
MRKRWYRPATRLPSFGALCFIRIYSVYSVLTPATYGAFGTQFSYYNSGFLFTVPSTLIHSWRYQ